MMVARDDDPLPFDLRALKMFLAVCEAGSMSGAARRLNVTQPAVSQTVAELEAGTGAMLLDRTTRPLGVTASGALLRQRASALLAEARQIAPLLRQAGDGRLSLLRIGLVDSLSRAAMPALAAQTRMMAEQTVFLSGLTEAHAAALLTRQLDMFLGADDLPDLPGVERWALFEEPYILIVPASLGLEQALRLDTLAAKLPFIRFSARSRTGADIERHLRRLRLEIPQALAFDTPFGLAEAVACRHGWAISTPLCLYEAGIDLARLTICPLPKPGLSRALTLIAREKELGPAPKTLAGIVRAALSHTTVPALERAMPFLAGLLTIG